MLSCYLYRRRIGAWLDGALAPDAARAVGRHVSRCGACSAETDGLRRLHAALGAVATPADPDWSGFWPGVVRRIEDARDARPRAAVRRRSWLQPRWAYGGALAAALVVSLTVWQLLPEHLAPETSEMIVRSAQTDYPGGHVMVYSTPEKDLTVVWVFGGD